ncbi:DUF397 domain-containing protein [Streptomyces sp. KM273126]|uniref:DUF397 domain-containing protein n=1 Tax=Streptomyces sp. KM273126 TaxID=2545247 RepID=UPI00103A120D|nr:DUF397 domain-containing protein [Streptomyces sp. KM273126]MBA2806361.1 DUF397 domain-containing protein [Streptomyces sp. KM273126]
MPSHSSEWFKSSYSGPNGECLEARLTAPGVNVRDSKAIPGPLLAFAPNSWNAFLRTLSANALLHTASRGHGSRPRTWCRAEDVRATGGGPSHGSVTEGGRLTPGLGRSGLG